MKFSTVRRLQRHLLQRDLQRRCTVRLGISGLKYSVLGLTVAIALGLAQPSLSLSVRSERSTPTDPSNHFQVHRMLMAQSEEPTLQLQPTQPGPPQVFADEGQQLYQSGRLQEAEASLEQALLPYPEGSRGIRQAVALSNLALVQGQLGKWTEANENLSKGLEILGNATLPAPEPLRKSVQAQVLDVQGRLQYSQGQPQDALQTWRKSSALYGRLGNLESQVRSEIRQAQAMRALGFYRLAIDSILTPIRKSLEDQPTSTAKVASLQNLGEALQIAGDLKDAEAVLRDSLMLAEELKEPEAIAHSQLSLANTLQAQVLKKLPPSKQRDFNLNTRKFQTQIKATQTAYEAVISTSRNPLNRLRAQLNYLSFALELRRPQTAQQIWSNLQNLNAIPVSRAGIDAQVNLVDSLMELQDQRPRAVSSATIERILAQAYSQSTQIDDLRAQSYVLGELGTFYQRQRDASRALEFTQKAILLANAVNAPDIAYQWYAQQGDLLTEQGKGNRGEAIAAYQAAVKNLGLLRSDLAAVNPDATFSFQESVDPIHRKLVSLLLEQYRESPEGLGLDTLGEQHKAADADDPKDEDKEEKPLEEIQGIMESLRVEELHEYFRAACLDAQEVNVQKVATEEKAAVIYPIVLEDELATIVTLPGQTPKLYSTSTAQTSLEETVESLRYALLNRIDTEGFKQPAQQVYNLLFPQGLQADLDAKDTQALVFVLDGVLRNIPMAALWDGQQFLIQKYGIASTPGLQLVAPTPIQERGLGAVAFSLSEGREVDLGEEESSIRFTDLPNVEKEIQALEKNIPSTEVIADERFTKASFKQILRRSTAPIVHLATHGRFSSDRESTFLLAAKQDGSDEKDDGLIKLDELASALQVGAGDRTQPVELLVLSACETALGDDRAALGIAGVALRSGARSTVASLWTVDDEATSDLMAEFYELLKKDRTISKAEALRQAQLHFLEDLESPENNKFRRYRKHPYHWASFILVGNWL